MATPDAATFRRRFPELAALGDEYVADLLTEAGELYAPVDGRRYLAAAHLHAMRGRRVDGDAGLRGDAWWAASSYGAAFLARASNVLPVAAV